MDDFLLRTGHYPIRWWCWDNTAPTEHLWLPPEDSPTWEVRYDNDCEHGKLTTRKIGDLTKSVQDHFRDLRALKEQYSWRERLGYPVYDDPEMHGGGLHMMLPGGWLNCHLDYDVHPHRKDARRALNIVSFIHQEWVDEWGGELYFADPFGEPVQSFTPRPGRIVAFEVSDASYHGVMPIHKNANPRVTAAVYYLCDSAITRPCDQVRLRKRAMFLPTRRPM